MAVKLDLSCRILLLDKLATELFAACYKKRRAVCDIYELDVKTGGMALQKTN